VEVRHESHFRPCHLDTSYVTPLANHVADDISRRVHFCHEEEERGDPLFTCGSIIGVAFIVALVAALALAEPLRLWLYMLGAVWTAGIVLTAVAVTRDQEQDVYWA